MVAEAAPQQVPLFGHGIPTPDEGFAHLREIQLSASAWVAHCPGWLSGHQELFIHLMRTTLWREESQELYDQVVQTPRLVAALPKDGPGHPVIHEMRALLSARYGVELSRVSLALYRDGSDSVAWHGDRVARDLPESLMATVSVGEPRTFALRPKAEGRARHSFQLGWGDLMVMGGSCQRTWEHGVPKRRHAGPRMAIMFRPSLSRARASAPVV
jgi:alkylated DNA repair dioxygenase AlkB